MAVITVDGYRQKRDGYALYARAKADMCREPQKIRLIPYRCFANRGQTDMLTWLREK